MNKYLMLSAAAAMSATGIAASTVDADAGVQSVYVTATFSGSTVTFCDAITLAWSGTLYENIDDEQTYCGLSGVFGIGNGVSGKLPRPISSHVDVSNSIENTWQDQLNFDLGLGKTGPKDGRFFDVWLTYVSSGYVYTFESVAGKYHFGVPRHAGGNHPSLTKLASNHSHVSAVKGLSLKK